MSEGKWGVRHGTTINTHTRSMLTGLSSTKPVPSVVLFFVLKGTARRSNGPPSEFEWCTQLPHGAHAHGHCGRLLPPLLLVEAKSFLNFRRRSISEEADDGANQISWPGGVVPFVQCLGGLVLVGKPPPI